MQIAQAGGSFSSGKTERKESPMAEGLISYTTSKMFWVVIAGILLGMAASGLWNNIVGANFPSLKAS